MRSRKLTLDGGGGRLLADGAPSKIDAYDLSSASLPIALTNETEKQFDGWYNDAGSLMSVDDLPLVSGDTTWTARFSPVQSGDIELRFSEGTTNGSDVVNLTNDTIIIGGVSVTAMADSIVVGDYTAELPALTYAAAQACKTPIEVVAEHAGYQIPGTMMSREGIDVTSTDECTAGDVYRIYMIRESKTVTFNAGDIDLIVTSGNPHITTIENPVKLPLVMRYAEHAPFAYFGGWSTDGTLDGVVNSALEIPYGKTTLVPFWIQRTSSYANGSDFGPLMRNEEADISGYIINTPVTTTSGSVLYKNDSYSGWTVDKDSSSTSDVTYFVRLDASVLTNDNYEKFDLIPGIYQFGGPNFYSYIGNKYYNTSNGEVIAYETVGRNLSKGFAV